MSESGSEAAAVPLDDQSTKAVNPVVPGSEDSSSDSDGSSRSRSGSESSTSKESAVCNNRGKEENQSSEPSDKGEVESESGSESGDSFKSVSTPSAKTPKSAKGVQPIVNQSGDSKNQVSSPKPIEGIKRDNNGAKSPIPITPAKSLVIGGGSPVVVKAKELEDEVATAKASDIHVEPETPPCKSTAVSVTEEPAAQPLPLATPKASKDKPEVSGSNRKRTNTKSVDPKTPSRSPTAKKSRKVHRKKKSSPDKMKLVEEMEEKVKRLQKRLDKVAKDEEAMAKRQSKKTPKSSKESSKSKQAIKQSNEDSQSSSPEEPATSSRIAKIPEGRKLQRLAMSRSKQLGVIRQGQIHEIEVIEALKIIDATKFTVQPSHAYKRFMRVPGMGLPHIRQYTADFCNRYGLTAQSVAKLNLMLTRDFDQAKKLMVGPEAGNQFASLWQFSNDLTRALATDQEVEVPKSVNPVVVPEVDKVKEVETVGANEAVANVNEASASGDRSGKTKTAKKKKKKDTGHASGPQSD